MKKKLLSFGIIVLTCILVISFFKKDAPEEEKRNTYVFSPKMTDSFFGCTPSQFVKGNNHLAINDYGEDFYTHASVDENGNLMLRLTEQQEKDMVSQYGNTDFEALENTIEGLTFLENETGMIIRGNKKQIINVIWSLPFFVVQEMAAKQVFVHKKTPEEVAVSVTIIDAGNDKVLYTATWPHEDFSFDTDDYTFFEPSDEDESTQNTMQS